ncbi:MAG: T9SS type A sorting domain-containing protein [Saprospiraceae bacterium]
MKNSRLFSIIGILALSGFNLKAQVALPYYTGFDNLAQQSGWIEYKKASTQFSHWGYGSFTSYSEPNYIGHDYSPATGITLTDNWFVSPAFSINNGGKLDSLRYSFKGFSQPLAGDTIAIYLLNGSQDPALVTSKMILFDFRDADYIADGEYRGLTNISLPAFSGSSHLAIRYRNSNCSSNWLTVAFDNIAISGNSGVGLDDLNDDNDKVVIYPNPATGKFSIKHKSGVHSFVVQNNTGQKIYETVGDKFGDTTEINLSTQPKGIYYVKIQQGSETITKKIMLQ